jgi:hypothetical protein
MEKLFFIILQIENFENKMVDHLKANRNLVSICLDYLDPYNFNFFGNKPVATTRISNLASYIIIS